MSSERNTISRASGYTAIPNAVARDPGLSIEARGFLALLMSMREGWVFRRNHLMKSAGIGRDKYRRIMREIQDAGYVRIETVHDDNGRFLGNHWIINDEPQPQDVDTGGLKTRPTVTGGLKNRPPVLPAGGETRPLKNTNEDKKPNPKGGSGFGISPAVEERLRKEGYL